MKIYYYCLFFPFLLFSETVRIDGFWTCNKNVINLYPTPLGSVYKFETIKNDTRGDQLTKIPSTTNLETEKEINGGVLFFTISEKKRLKKRFVVVDFKVRTFPALTSEPSEHFRFQFFVTSDSQLPEIYPSPEEILTIDDYGSFGGQKSITGIHIPHRLLPDFEPISIRLIYDKSQEILTTNLNGKKDHFKLILGNKVYSKKQKRKGFQYPICSIGVFSSERESFPENTIFRKEYFEISSPTIFLCDTETDLEKLPIITFSPYPYDNYSLNSKKNKITNMFREIKRNKNPDLLYAYALKYLYGKKDFFNPQNGVELLKKAARKKHVLAKFQLGICYFRGYGVKPDLREAMKYWKDAEKHGCQNALALQWYALWDSSGRPNFETNTLNKLSVKLNKQMQKEPTLEYYSGFVLMRVFMPMLPEIFSFKALTFFSVRHDYISTDKKLNKKLLVDYALESGYLPAYRLKAISFLEDNLPQKALEYLKIAVRKGDLNAYPDYLYIKNILGILNKSDFTESGNYMYSEDCLYHILFLSETDIKYKEIIQKSDYWFKRGVMPNKNAKNERTPQEKLLCYLMNMNLSRYGNLQDNLELNQLQKYESFLQLQDAARKDKLPIAYYFLARHFYYNTFPPGVRNEIQMNSSDRIEEAQRLLTKAVESGYFYAQLFLAEVKMSSSVDYNRQVLDLLAPLCARGIPKAFYLRAECLRRMKRYSEATLAGILAAEKGEYKGWLVAALSAEKMKQPKYIEFWNQYITADISHRVNDIYDPYSSDIYSELGRWEKNNQSVHSEGEIKTMKMRKRNYGYPEIQRKPVEKSKNP